MSEAQPIDAQGAHDEAAPAENLAQTQAKEQTKAVKPAKASRDLLNLRAVRESLSHFEESYQSPEVKARKHSKATIICLVLVALSIPLEYVLPAGSFIWSLMQDGALALAIVLFVSKRFALIKEMRPLLAVATVEMLIMAVIFGWYITVNTEQIVSLSKALWEQLNSPHYVGGASGGSLSRPNASRMPMSQ